MKTTKNLGLTIEEVKKIVKKKGVKWDKFTELSFNTQQKILNN